MQRPQRIALFVFVGAAAAALFATFGGREAAPPPESAASPAIERPADGQGLWPGASPSATSGGAQPAASAGRDAAPALPEGRDFDPEGDPADAPFVETFGEPTPELVRAAIEAAVADLFADRPLTPAEIDRAAEALVELRAARAELDRLAMEPAQAERRRALIEALGHASETFRATTGMSPAEFTTRAAEVARDPARRGDLGSLGNESENSMASGGGIDRGVDPDYVPSDDYLPPRSAEPEPTR